MFRLWAKTFKNNHMLQDTVICDNSEDTRTHKVFRALDEVCIQFDLGRPLWLDSDSFMEQIDFDYLEIQMLEEDASSLGFS